MEKYSKLCLIIFPIIFLIIVLYSSIAIYIHDPLQVWHKPFFRKEFQTYSYTIRESAKAMIRDYDFDSVIIGNSHSENTSSKKANEIIPGKNEFFNLSISGSTAYEKKIFLDYLFKQKNIKQVIYLLDSNYLSQKTETKTFPVKNYDFLYNSNSFDDYKIYLNDRYFFCSLLFRNNEKCTGKKLDADRPYAWDNEEKYKKRFGGFGNWIKNREHSQIKDLFKDILKTPKKINNNPIDEEYIFKSHEYIDKYLYTLISKHKDTKFYVVFPPVSNIKLALMVRDKEQSFAKSIDMLKYITEQNKKYDNIELYAFDDIEYIGDIKLYKDASHFNTDINYFILEAIAKKEHRLTADNVEDYIKKVTQKAYNVDFDYYYDKIKQLN